MVRIPFRDSRCDLPALRRALRKLEPSDAQWTISNNLLYFHSLLAVVPVIAASKWKSYRLANEKNKSFEESLQVLLRNYFCPTKDDFLLPSTFAVHCEILCKEPRPFFFVEEWVCAFLQSKDLCFSFVLWGTIIQASKHWCWIRPIELRLVVP